MNTKLFPLHISGSTLLLHVSCVISSQSSLLTPLNHPHWSLFSNHQFTPVSRSQTAFSGMPHLCNKLPAALHVSYQFNPSSSPSSSPSSRSDHGPFVDISHGARILLFTYVTLNFLVLLLSLIYFSSIAKLCFVNFLPVNEYE